MTRGKRALALSLWLTLGLHARSFAMTSDDLIDALEKVGAEEVRLLKGNSIEIEEKKPDFLRDGTYLRVAVETPHHVHLLHYVVGPAGVVYRLKLGQPELERMQKELGIQIENPETALSYAQWVLEVTEGPALWLLSSVNDVPFQPVPAGEDELAKRVELAKKEILRRITKPSARAQGEDFIVTQEAVQRRDLVRYEVTVSRRGRCTIEREKLVSELPVVYVVAR